jgi:hypothetical protein
MELNKREALFPKNVGMREKAGSGYLFKLCSRLLNFPRKGNELGMRKNDVRKAEK